MRGRFRERMKSVLRSLFVWFFIRECENNSNNNDNFAQHEKFMLRRVCRHLLLAGLCFLLLDTSSSYNYVSLFIKNKIYIFYKEMKMSRKKRNEKEIFIFYNFLPWWLFIVMKSTVKHEWEKWMCLSEEWKKCLQHVIINDTLKIWQQHVIDHVLSQCEHSICEFLFVVHNFFFCLTKFLMEFIFKPIDFTFHVCASKQTNHSRAIKLRTSYEYTFSCANNNNNEMEWSGREKTFEWHYKENMLQKTAAAWTLNKDEIARNLQIFMYTRYIRNEKFNNFFLLIACMPQPTTSSPFDVHINWIFLLFVISSHNNFCCCCCCCLTPLRFSLCLSFRFK
jgi:hypothetical protein